MKKPFHHYRIDCATQGVQETWARSADEAESRVKWRLRQRGVYPVTNFWKRPEIIGGDQGCEA